MANLIYKQTGTRNLIEDIGYGRLAISTPTVYDFTLMHDSKYSIEVTGMYIRPKLVDYSGSRSPEADYQEILYWGTKWNRGLTLTQPRVGYLTSGDTVFKNGVGTKRNPIQLAFNGGVIAARGKRGTVDPVDEPTTTLLWEGAGGTSLVLGNLLIGTTAHSSKLDQLGIICSGYDATYSAQPMVSIKAVDGSDITSGGMTVIGKMRVSTPYTDAFLRTNSVEIDGSSAWFIVDLYTTDGNPYTATSPFNIIYKTREASYYYDEVPLSLTLDIPEYIKQPYKYDFAFDVDFRELK